MRRQPSWFSKQEKHIQFSWILLLIGVVAASIFLIIKAGASDKKIVQVHFLALLAGLVFEYKRLSENWSTVLLTALGAYILSFTAFIKSKEENAYLLETHLEMWPYFFLGAFILIATIVQYSAATKRLTEGITLLLTFAINYWIIANDLWHTDSVFQIVLIALNVIFSLFSLFNALSYNSLNPGVRLILSIWSSIILLILAIDNLFKLDVYSDIESLTTFPEKIFAFIQFFLVGVSSIYMVQNLTMLLAYLPGKKYWESVREINEVHLGRFSPEEVHKLDALIIALINFSGFLLNYFFQFLPVNFMIWTMITLSPLVLYVIHGLLR